MTHGYAIIPDVLTVLFIFACYVKLTSKPKNEAELMPVVKAKKSIYPIPRGRMS